MNFRLQKIIKRLILADHLIRKKRGKLRQPKRPHFNYEMLAGIDLGEEVEVKILSSYTPDFFEDGELYYFQNGLKGPLKAESLSELRQKGVRQRWELLRYHTLFLYTLKYGQSQEQPYLNLINEHLDFLAKNEATFYGETNSMELAIRATNLIYAFAKLKAMGVLDAEREEILLSQLWKSKCLIESQLEKNYPYSGNHYLFNLLGLAYLNQLFGETKAKSEFYLNELIYEINAQVINGFHFENSTTYHLQLVEALAIFIQANDNVFKLPLPKRIVQVILDGVDRLSYFLSGAVLKRTGDDDSGAFLVPFYQRNLHMDDYMKIYPLMLSGHQLNEQPMQRAVNSFSPKEFLVANGNGLQLFVWNFDFSRLPDNNRLQYIHNHQNNFAFELTKEGIEFLVSAGTFTYADSELRNAFRGVAGQNSLTVDGKANKIFSDENLFSSDIYLYTKDLEYQSDDRHTEITCHDTIGSVVVKRNFVLSERLEICDQSNGGMISSILLLHPEVEIRQKESQKLVLFRNSVELSINFDPSTRYAIDSYEHSAFFDHKSQATKLVLKTEGAIKEIKYTIG